MYDPREKKVNMERCREEKYRKGVQMQVEMGMADGCLRRAALLGLFLVTVWWTVVDVVDNASGRYLK
jgi:hypothetical protein